MRHIYKCQCGKYTMKQECECGQEVITTKPPKYSPGKFAKYRREARRDPLKQKGLL